MSDDLDKLEREIDAALATLAQDLAVEPPEGVVLRVKAATGQALNEDWLASQPEPAPSDTAVSRVRAAVHAELEGAGHAAVPRRLFRMVRSPAWSALAAAAVIGICVGLIHYAGAGRTSTVLVAPGAEERLTYFAETAEALLAEAPVASDVLAKIDALAERVASWAPESAYDETGDFNEIINVVDELLAEPELDDSTSRGRVTSAGVFG